MTFRINMPAFPENETLEEQNMRHYAACYWASDVLGFVLHKSTQEIEKVIAVAQHFKTSPIYMLECEDFFRVQCNEMEEFGYLLSDAWSEEVRKDFWLKCKIASFTEIKDALRMVKEILLDLQGLEELELARNYEVTEDE